MRKRANLSAMALALTLGVCCMMSGCGSESVYSSVGSSGIENPVSEENTEATTEETTESTTIMHTEETTTTTTEAAKVSDALLRGHSNVLIGYANPTSLSKCLQLLGMQVSELDLILGLEGPDWEAIQSLAELQSAVQDKELVIGEGHHLMCEEDLQLEEVIDLFREKDFTPIIVNNKANGDYFILKGATYSEIDANYFIEFLIYDRTSNGKSELYYDFIVNHEEPTITKLETADNELKLEYRSDHRFEAMWFE